MEKNTVRRIIVATSNAGKLKEIREILADFELPVVSLKEAEIQSDPEENGTTFRENAVIKVKDVMGRPEAADAVVIADDSGLEIDYLNGEPGVYSARYLGHETSYEYKNQVIRERLEKAQGAERRAQYVCAMAAGFADGTILTAEGIMAGEISRTAAGNGGFGYDPIFYLPEYGKTAAQLTAEEKNAISHRGKALRGLKELLARKLQEK